MSAPPAKIDVEPVTNTAVPNNVTESTPQAAEEQSELVEVDFISLVSGDGYEFLVPRCCILSPVIRRQLQLNRTETTVTLDAIRAPILHLVVQYWQYRRLYGLNPNRPPFEIPDEYALEVQAAAAALKT